MVSRFGFTSPIPFGLTVDTVINNDGCPTVTARSRAAMADCPLCDASWRRVQSCYVRRPVEPMQYISGQFRKLLADHGVTCSISRSGNVWDNAAMESFFSSLKTERTARKVYRTRDQARADVFDYIERFYNPRRRHSTIGYFNPMDFERNAASA